MGSTLPRSRSSRKLPSAPRPPCAGAGGRRGQRVARLGGAGSVRAGARRCAAVAALVGRGERKGVGAGGWAGTGACPRRSLQRRAEAHRQAGEVAHRICARAQWGGRGWRATSSPRCCSVGRVRVCPPSVSRTSITSVTAPPKSRPPPPPPKLNAAGADQRCSPLLSSVKRDSCGKGRPSRGARRAASRQSSGAGVAAPARPPGPARHGQRQHECTRGCAPRGPFRPIRYRRSPPCTPT